MHFEFHCDGIKGEYQFNYLEYAVLGPKTSGGSRVEQTDLSLTRGNDTKNLNKPALQ